MASSDGNDGGGGAARTVTWIVIAVLAVIVAVGGVRALTDDGSGDGDADQPARTTTEQPDVDDADPDADATVPPAGEDQAADDDPESDSASAELVIGTEAAGVDGSSGSRVTQFGPVPFAADTLPTIETFIEALGPVSSSGADPQVRDYCLASWSEIGLTAYFYYGHPPSLRDSCTRGAIITAVVGAGWSTDRGLEVGDDMDRIEQLYPDSEPESVSPGFARIIGSDELYALTRASYGGTPYTNLSAAVIAGQVSALVYFSGAD